MIALAQYGMEKYLDALWRSSFHDSSKTTHAFFRHRFEPHNCVVALEDGVIVSALYLLEARVTAQDGAKKTAYVYAASTLPEYRNHGYMTRLLAYAHTLCERRGFAYMALVPASQSLFRFYAKEGYAPYFKIQKVALSREALRRTAAAGRRDAADISRRLLAGVRRDWLAPRPGSLLWNPEAVAFAVRYQRVCGGEVYSSARDGSVGYAFFRRNESIGEVTELCADALSLPGLLYQILDDYKCTHFTFRLPAGASLLGEMGETIPFGMLKALGGNSLPPVQDEAPPYLGLGLD